MYISVYIYICILYLPCYVISRVNLKKSSLMNKNIAFLQTEDPDHQIKAPIWAKGHIWQWLTQVNGLPKPWKTDFQGNLLGKIIYLSCHIVTVLNATSCYFRTVLMSVCFSITVSHVTLKALFAVIQRADAAIQWPCLLHGACFHIPKGTNTIDIRWPGHGGHMNEKGLILPAVSQQET